MSSTSTTSPTASSGSSGSGTPTSSSTNSPTTTDDGGGFRNSSTPLYLFTFLATLLVLLAVSCAIVLRSFYLRRGMRRRYEAAFAAGLIPPSEIMLTTGQRMRREFGEKPKLYDAAIVPAKVYGEKWDHVIPVAAKVLNIPSSPEPQTIPETPAQRSRLGALTDRARRTFYRRPSIRPSSASSSPPSSPNPDAPSEEDVEETLANASDVQVTVLIVMPHLHESRRGDKSGDHYWDDEEGEVPDVVIGVSRVALKKQP